MAKIVKILLVVLWVAAAALQAAWRCHGGAIDHRGGRDRTTERVGGLGVKCGCGFWLGNMIRLGSVSGYIVMLAVLKKPLCGLRE
jgi:hypothetical protein